jgi:hypothetical protein
MEPPFPIWQDHSTLETERYELTVGESIRAAVTRQRLPRAAPDYQAAIEIQGRPTVAPTAYATRSEAQEWALREIERHWLRKSTRMV